MYWISVKERLPKKTTLGDSQDVLITDGKNISIGWFEHTLQETLEVVRFFPGKRLWCCDACYLESYILGWSNVTHWMTLPLPPQTEKDQNCHKCKNELVACVCMEEDKSCDAARIYATMRIEKEDAQWAVDEAKRNEEDDRRFEAMQMIIMHGGHDGEHHKEWCLDQVFRILAGNQYQSIVDDQKNAGYDWKEGIAP